MIKTCFGRRSENLKKNVLKYTNIIRCYEEKCKYLNILCRMPQNNPTLQYVYIIYNYIYIYDYKYDYMCVYIYNDHSFFGFQNGSFSDKSDKKYLRSLPPHLASPRYPFITTTRMRSTPRSKGSHKSSLSRVSLASPCREYVYNIYIYVEYVYTCVYLCINHILIVVLHIEM